jgi:hypothetical protein
MVGRYANNGTGSRMTKCANAGGPLHSEVFARPRGRTAHVRAGSGSRPNLLEQLANRKEQRFKQLRLPFSGFRAVEGKEVSSPRIGSSN